MKRTKWKPPAVQTIRYFPDLAQFQRKCEAALRGVPLSERNAVTVTLTYHGHVPVGSRLLFVQIPEKVYAVAVSHLPGGQTVCTVRARAVLKAISSPAGGLRTTSGGVTESRHHPLPQRPDTGHAAQKGRARPVPLYTETRQPITLADII